MPQYCLIKHRIENVTIDGADPDRNPDRNPVTGMVTFTPLLGKGDAVLITENGQKTTLTLSPIEARITNGELWHRGEPGVKLFAGGPDSNPERIRYRAKFSNLIGGGKKVELKDTVFEAAPGGEMELSTVQPVPNQPYPGYTPSMEAAISEISAVRDSSIDYATTKIGEYRDEALNEADLSIQAAKEANTVPRVAALEAMGGLSPESPVDGQTANLVAQPATLTRTALDGNFANDDPLHILYRSGRALRKAHAAIERRNEKTCRIVFLGSSTTAGFNATDEYGYVSYFTERIQAVYPSSAGVEIPMGTRAGQYQPSVAPGVQVVNMGGGGSHSGNYLLAGVVGALKPDVAIHMIGSNDWNTNVEPSTYRTNVENAIATIDSRSGFRCVHIFIHQHERHQYTPRAYPFSAYRDVLRDIALADPDYVMLIDLTAEFRRLGIPNPDPFVLLDTDRIHLTDRGHQFLTEALFTRLGIPTSKVVGEESAPPPPEEPTLVMVTSDGFGDDSTSLGTRPSDVAHGGTPITPSVVSSSAMATSGGSLVGLPGTGGRLTWAHTKQDVEASIVVVAPPEVSSISIFSRYTSSDHYAGAVIKVASIGAAVLEVNGTQYGGNQAYQAGDTIAVRSVGDVHQLLINGSVKATATVGGVTSEGSRISMTEGARLDDLKIAEVIPG